MGDSLLCAGGLMRAFRELMVIKRKEGVDNMWWHHSCKSGQGKDKQHWVG